MKKCGWCGKEYPDSATECALDGAPLPAGEPEPAIVAAIPDSALPPVILPKAEASAELPIEFWTDRRLRIAEVVLVCIVAFGSPLLGSTFYLFEPRAGTRPGSAWAWANSFLHEATAIGPLWYVLKRRSRSFSAIGVSWRKSDLPWSLLLFVAGYLTFVGLYALLYVSGATQVSRSVATVRVGRHLFGGGVSVVALVFQFINPFFEELTVRGYLMTELKDLTGSVSKAVLASTLLQMSYHFYQGGPSALSNGAIFLLFSLYFARTGRLTPLILAHLYMDVGGTLSYWLWRG